LPAPRAFGPNITIDLETTTKKSYKRLANPFDPDNKIVYVGWAVGDELPKMQRFGLKDMPPGWFAAMLRKYWPRLLVGQNIKFDLLYLIRNPIDYAAYMEWVAAGGLIWDDQLAEYLLNGMGQADQMVSLDEMAPRYGGNVKFDEVKALWQDGVLTEDIDPDLMRRYLIGEEVNGVWEDGDIGNTRIVMKGQLERARAAGQVKSILMNMGSLLCTIEMEKNGMAVDLKRGRELALGLEEKIALLVAELVDYLPEDLPFDFNWGSPAQKSALIFGGTVMYDKWLPHLNEDGQMQYAMKDEVHYVLVGGGTTPDAPGSLSVEEGGWAYDDYVTYVSGKNAGEVKTKKVKVPNYDKPKGAIQKVPYTFEGYTDPSERWETSTPGQYQTGAEVIAELGNRDIAFLQALSKRTQYAKDLTTYYITVSEKTGEEVGMLTLVQADGIIHHMLNHTSTVTGRFSSSNPNLQNLPKGNKSDVKTIFVSRFAGGKIIQSDFSSLEVYVQAILTKCQNLISDLLDGLDMHCVRVSQKEGITYEEALYRCKDESYEHHKEWDTKRTKAKVFSFQRAYGAGASKISESAKIPFEEVEALIAAEEKRYPEVAKFNEALIQHLEDNACETNIFVQHPDLPGVTCNLKTATWRAPDNKLYLWRQSPAPKFLATKPASKGGKIASFSPTEAKNYPVQGTGGEWAKAAMWLAIREFYRLRNFDGAGLLVNQVHDALYGDSKAEYAQAVAATIHACMEEASAFMEFYFGWEVPVPVPSDTTYGDDMGGSDKFPAEFKEEVRVNRRLIRNLYMNDYKMIIERKAQA